MWWVLLCNLEESLHAWWFEKLDCHQVYVCVHCVYMCVYDGTKLARGPNCVWTCVCMNTCASGVCVSVQSCLLVTMCALVYLRGLQGLAACFRVRVCVGVGGWGGLGLCVGGGR